MAEIERSKLGKNTDNSSHIKRVEFDLLQLDVDSPQVLDPRLLPLENYSDQDLRTLMMLYYPPTRQWLRAFSNAAYELYQTPIEKKSSPFAHDIPIPEFDPLFAETSPLSQVLWSKYKNRNSVLLPLIRALDEMKLTLVSQSSEENCQITLKLGTRSLASKMPLVGISLLNRSIPNMQYEFLQKMGYKILLLGPSAKQKDVDKFLKQIQAPKKSRSVRKEPNTFFQSAPYYVSNEIPSLGHYFDRFLKRCQGSSWTEIGSSEVNKPIRLVVKFITSEELKSKWEAKMEAPGHRVENWKSKMTLTLTEDFADYKQALKEKAFIYNECAQFFFSP